MPHHEMVALRGVIRDVFAHRFTLESEGQVHLADIGPKGAEQFTLQQGLDVALRGEKRPSEIKVFEINRIGAAVVLIEHKKPHHSPKHRGPHHHSVVDPETAMRAVKTAGWSIKGHALLKPKHVEFLARKGNGPWTELHVDGLGDIYKEKPVSSDGEKWADIIAA